MILEDLHYLEKKHAQHVRKIHVMRSFHVTAARAPRCTQAYETAQGSDGADVS
jgi:hypothetical protein